MTDDRAFLRHTLATLAYRGGKATRGADPEFATFKASPSTRMPIEIVSHIGDLLEWGLSLAEGKQRYNENKPVSWEGEVQRFHRNLQALDNYLASDAPLDASALKLFQGPVADALTHVGQVAMLRRMAGEPILGENYYVAMIETGRTGPDQAPGVKEFE